MWHKSIIDYAFPMRDYALVGHDHAINMCMQAK